MMDRPLPTIDLKRCNRCGICVTHCPTSAVEMMGPGPVIVRPEDCTYCGTCDAWCPQSAITCSFEIVWETD